MPRQFFAVLSLTFVLPFSAAAQQLRVGSEQQLSVPDLQAAAFDQTVPAVASDGNGWLTVWLSGGWAGSADVAAARVDAGGHVIDASPIVIARQNTAAPAVAWGGGHYLVAWSQWSQGDCVIGRFVNPDGVLLPPVVIASDIKLSVRDLRVVSSGSDFLVVWTEAQYFGYPFRVKAAHVDARGNVSSALTFGDSTSMQPALTATPAGFFVAYSIYDGSLVAQRIDRSGATGSPLTLAPPKTGAFLIRAASDGANTLVLWHNSLSDYRINGAWLTPDGSIKPISTFSSGTDAIQTLTWAGSNYILTLTGTQAYPQHAAAMTLHSTGVPGRVVVFQNVGGDLHDAAWNGRFLLVAMGLGRGANTMPSTASDVGARFLDGSAVPVDPGPGSSRSDLLDPAGNGLPLALSPRHQTAPSIAPISRDDALAVWSEVFGEDGPASLMAMPLRGGLPRLAQSIAVGETWIAPAVAANDNEYFVVWSAAISLVGSRLDRDGNVLDSTPITLAQNSGPRIVVVTWDGENFVVAHTSQSCNGLTPQLHFTRVSAAGTVLDPTPVAIGNTPCGAVMSLSSGPNGSLLVARRVDPAYGTTTRAYAFVTRGGATTGGFPLDALPDGPSAAAWNGERFVVASAAASADAKSVRIAWTSFDANAFPAGMEGAITISGYSSVTTVAVSRFGGGTLIALIAGRNTSNVTDTLAVQLTPDGARLGQPFVIATGGSSETYLSLAGDGSGRAWLAYDRTIGQPGLEDLLMRVFARQIDSTVPPRRRAAR